MKEKLKEPGISIFQRYLTLWVLLCIPNALHTASKVGSVGALFLLNIFVTVEWERFASFASR